jgi:hypothetical protein
MFVGSRRVFVLNAGKKVINGSIGQVIVMVLVGDGSMLGGGIEESVIGVCENSLVGAKSIDTIAVIECAVIIKKVVD